MSVGTAWASPRHHSQCFHHQLCSQFPSFLSHGHMAGGADGFCSLMLLAQTCCFSFERPPRLLADRKPQKANISPRPHDSDKPWVLSIFAAGSCQ